MSSRYDPEYYAASAPGILDDMEHHVREAIAQYREAAGFPRLSDYGVSEEELDDYLFDKQAVIDNVDDLKKKYTTWSVIFLIPIVIMDFFEVNFKNLMIGIAGGCVLCCLYWVLMKTMKYFRMRRIHNEAIERYISDVLAFKARAEAAHQDS